MINIIYNEAGQDLILQASGHAEYAPKGQDIVCAAVSVLMLSLAYSVDSGSAVQDGEGVLTVKAVQSCDNSAKFELVTDGLQLLAEQYPTNVRYVNMHAAGTDELDLQMFADGAAGGDGGAAGEGAAGSGAAVQAPELRPAQERLAKRSHPGKSAKAGAPAPAADSGADAGGEAAKEEAPGEEKPETQQEKQEPEQKPADPAEKRRAFGQLMQSEYAAEFEEAMQRAAQLAVQNVQQSPEVKGLLEALGEAYGIDAQDANNLAALTDAIKNGKIKNDEYYETMAAERGISVKTAREMDRMESELQRANAEKQRTEQLRAAMEHQQRAAAVRAQWEAEAAQLKVKYPEFELDEVLNNPSVADMIRRGIGLEAAYRAAYFDKLMEASTARTAQQVEQGVAARIQQRAQRPAENGAHPGGAAEMKVDVAHMTAKQRAELAKRARRGERIVL